MSNTIKQVMTKDHKYCDDLFIHLESLVMDNNWQQAERQIQICIDSVVYHFKYEEEVLFAEFEATTNNTSGPTMMMRHEHEQMRMLMDELKQSIDNQNHDRYSGLAETLNIFIQQHNIKEEGILYPMIDSACEHNKDHLLVNILHHRDIKVA